MKKVLISFALFVGVSVSAEAAIQTFSASDTGGATRTKLNSNFSELDTTKETKAVVQASAPADTSVDWYDTDQEVGVLILKRHNGTTWVRASSHGVQYASSCTAITGGMCVDTDDGKLYYYNGTAVVEVGSGGGDYTLPTASGSVLGGVKVGSRLTITDGVLSADVQSGTFDPTADIDFTGNVDFTGATVIGILPAGNEGDFYRVGTSGPETVAPLTPVAGSNITLTTDTTAGTVTIASTGGATYPGAGIPQSTGSAWGTSITPGTGVATALAAAVDGTGGLASKAALDALSVGAPITSAPTYSDSACTTGQYAFSATPPQYWCKATNTWDYQVVSGSSLVWANWSNPTPDTTPNAFTFADTQTDATLSTQYCSAQVTPTGFNAAATIVSTGTGANKGWKIDGGSFATTGTLSPGSAIQTCHDSSASNSTSTTSSLTIGGVAATSPFTTTTLASSNIFTDTFDRADIDPLASPWVVLGTYTTLKIVSNDATSSDTTEDGSMYYNSVSSVDHYSSIVFGASTGYAYTGPTVRAGTNGKSCYRMFWSGGTVYVQHRSSTGAGTTLSQVTKTSPIAGTVYKLSMSGNTLTATIDGVQIWSGTPGTIISAGYPGITISGSSNKVASWEGGGL